MDVLIEVNMGGEESKFGVAPEETEALLREISVMEHIRVRGLMTVAPFVEDQEENREVFRQMRELLVDMNSKKIDNIKMDTLSMGMTGDYEVAIEEGATIVRVGTGIFGERYYPNKG
jgi:pyridoxal phosphate enzyme (YggS family)